MNPSPDAHPDPTMPPLSAHADTAQARRRHWLAVLAHAPRDALQRHAEAIDAAAFDVLRAPELGLTMLRARIGHTGDRFNLGEATTTRCVLRHRGVTGTVAVGLGCVLGRDTARAEWVARLDALLQQPEHHDALMREVIGQLQRATTQQRALQATRTAASRVRFFEGAPDAPATPPAETRT